MKTFVWELCFVAGCTIACATASAQPLTLYVAPDASDGGPGRDTNPGTQARPATLDQIANGTYRPTGGSAVPIPAGSTIWMMPGTYRAPATTQGWHWWDMRLAGAPGLQTTLRSQVGANGEHAVVDGGLRIMGGHVTYWGMEVVDNDFKNSARLHADSLGNGNRLGALVYTNNPHNGNGIPTSTYNGLKFVNMDVHDGVQGFAVWASAPDAEIHGALIHDNGYDASDRGHGHGIYTQNIDMGGNTKRISENIMFRGYAYNLHAYGEGGKVQNYDVEGNISFSAATKRTSVANNQYGSYLMGSALPMDNIRFEDNVGYNARFNGQTGSGEFGFVLDNATHNGDLEFHDNYIAGQDGLEFNDWLNVHATGNTIVSKGHVLDNTNTPGGYSGRNWTFSNNTYLTPSPNTAFNGTSFANYKATTGIAETGSTAQDSDLVQLQNYVFVEPNDYEEGRGHVAIVNWQNFSSMAVDLSSILGVGASYMIWNVENGIYDADGTYATPIVNGVYNGGLVNLPLDQTGETTQFDAFLVIGSYGPVPEPAALTLLTALALPLVGRRRRRTR